MDHQDSKKFIEALTQNNLSVIKEIPKSDLHNHFVLGGSRRLIQEQTGIEILPYNGILNSMNEMHAWSEKFIGASFNSTERRKLLIEATFVQAKEDGVKLLEIGEDVWGLESVF